MMDKTSSAEERAAEKSCDKSKKKLQNADVQECGAVKPISRTKAVFLHLHFKNRSRRILNIILPINVLFQCL